MNINPYILLSALILALIFFLAVKKYNWEKKTSYHFTFIIVGTIGLIYFTYNMISEYKPVFLFINILLLLGIISKILKLLLIIKENKKNKE